MRPRLPAVVLVALALLTGCAQAPDPGDLAVFCDLLESGTGLGASPSAADLDRLAEVAPPGIQSTIAALQDRARDFDELLAEDPPNLEALFAARFDPAARDEQRALDLYAENSCGIVVDRPPATRWNNYTRDNHAGDEWVELVTAQFDVVADRIAAATLVFVDAPDPIGLVEQACEGVSDFLLADGADPGAVRVFVGSVVVLEYDSPDGLCKLP